MNSGDWLEVPTWILMPPNVTLLKEKAEGMQTQQFKINPIIHLKTYFFLTLLCVHLSLLFT